MRTPERWTAVGVPLAVVGTLIYVGVMSLLLLWFRGWLELVSTSRVLGDYRAVIWLAAAAATIRASFGAVGILLVIFLWVRSRSAKSRHRRMFVLAHLGAAVLVLLLQWAVSSALEAVPKYALIPISLRQ